MKNYLTNLDLPDTVLHPEYWSHTEDIYLRQLYAIVRKEKPGFIVELGTYCGYSTNAMAEALKQNFVEEGPAHPRAQGLVITVDLHQDHDYQPPEHLAPYVSVRVGNTGDRDLASTTILDGFHLDILFIDADHAYESTKADYEAWAPFVKPGGLILFHDIRNFPADCSRFWNEICQQYPGQTDQVDGSELGVFRKPAQPQPSVPKVAASEAIPASPKRASKNSSTTS